MSDLQSLLIVTFYRFLSLPDLDALQAELLGATRARDLRGTILLSHEGYNAALSGSREAIESFRDWLQEVHPEMLEGVYFKESFGTIHPYKRMLVKQRSEIITMGIDTIKPDQKTGPRIDPQDLKQWLDEDRDFILLDTRNDFEVRTGTFDRAVDLDLQTFKEFPERLQALPESVREKPVVMFCTGGIRCEKATAIAMEQGFKEVYQLEGGIINYFKECEGSHWDGDLFVFDERFAINPKRLQSATTLCVRCRNPYPELSSATTWSEFPPCPHCGYGEDAELTAG